MSLVSVTHHLEECVTGQQVVGGTASSSVKRMNGLRITIFPENDADHIDRVQHSELCSLQNIVDVRVVIQTVFQQHIHQWFQQS
eukprot:CAMPEP_0170130420 /NCGR_PEP_ID=MMETSP0020_2-20130122/22580_1 /TAXON_ID=98059 /ORGANISM="Dinobryon sp., Strain UTEXLB2267" /LENGTH=83 /DNA_ID=CAMNT_0010365177 /DNA_START=201 /DNA_END=448 /DNA_ORIENTATION=+